MSFFSVFLIAFVVLDIFLIVFILYRRSRRGLSSGVRDMIRDQWARVMKEDDGKHAILEADKLIDLTLKAYGYAGNLGDKLKAAEAHFSDINRLWRAHKVRNRIAHELDFQVDPRLRKECLKGFEQALRDLKVL